MKYKNHIIRNFNLLLEVYFYLIYIDIYILIQRKFDKYSVSQNHFSALSLFYLLGIRRQFNLQKYKKKVRNRIM